MLPPLPRIRHLTLFYMIERVKYSKIQLYLILGSILRRFPPGKWVMLGQMVEVRSKHSDFLIGV